MSVNGVLVHNMSQLPASLQHFHRRPLTLHHRVLGATVHDHQQRCQRRSQRCRAEERSRDRSQTQEAEKIVVPDTPPAKDSSRSSDVSLQVFSLPLSSALSDFIPTQGASSSAQPSGEVSEELKLLQQRKRESQAAAPSNYAQVLRSARYAVNLVKACVCIYMVVQAVLQEVRLIEWPKPKQVSLLKLRLLSTMYTKSYIKHGVLLAGSCEYSVGDWYCWSSHSVSADTQLISCGGYKACL